MAAINQNNDAFSEALLFIEKELGKGSVHLFLDSIHVDAEANHITLFAKNSACENEIQRRLASGITDILHKHGIRGCVTTVSADCKIPQAEQIFARRVNEVLGDDFEYMGHVDTEDGTFVVLKTALVKGGEKDGVLLMEVDVDPGEPITEYSFSVVEDDLILSVFRSFCEKYGAKNE